MEKGTVEIWNEAKGYGFIIADADGKKLFVHELDINEHPRILRDGQKVRFERQIGPKGLQATDVMSDY